MALSSSRLSLLLVLLTACDLSVKEWDSDSTPSYEPQTQTPISYPESEPQPPKEKIDRQKELLITSRSVIQDRRAIDGGAWSFQHFVPDSSKWLASFGTTTYVGPSKAPVTPRPKTSLTFRLIAIVNRFDIDELRFVYTAVNPQTQKADPMTVIVESKMPPCSVQGWHNLGKLPFGEMYNAALESITKDAVLTRLRTNEAIAGEEGWEMREFDGSLTQVPLATTPRLDLDQSPSLTSWISDNKSQIDTGLFTLPSGLQAGVAVVPKRSFRWNTTDTFNKATCNGCHGVSNALPFQHLAAADQQIADEYYETSSTNGETRISRWLESELDHREDSLREALRISACSKY